MRLEIMFVYVCVYTLLTNKANIKQNVPQRELTLTLPPVLLEKLCYCLGGQDAPVFLFRLFVLFSDFKKI